MKENYTMLAVDEIAYDPENPRIRTALEKYGDKVDEKRIRFALSSATEGNAGTSSYNRLRDSVLASKGVMSPITVIIKDGKYVCIDGNTRLAIYKELRERGAEGSWDKIKAVVLDDITQRDIETIRVSAHLVGSREWPAYAKAKYLHELRYNDLMSYDGMVALCGGNKPSIERQIQAYHDMNEYYREIVDDSAFQMSRFSGFVELQKRGVKEAIYDAGLTEKDFGEWIHDGRIYRLADVRVLPRVLRDDEARERFLKGGPRSIESAIRLLDLRKEQEAGEQDDKLTLESAPWHRLAEALSSRIDKLSLVELQALQDGEDEETERKRAALETLPAQLGRLLKLLEDVSE